MLPLVLNYLSTGSRGFRPKTYLLQQSLLLIAELLKYKMHFDSIPQRRKSNFTPFSSIGSDKVLFVRELKAAVGMMGADNWLQFEKTDTKLVLFD